MENFTLSNASLDQENYSSYLTTLYISAFLLSFLSPITVVSNSLLLFAIYKDPFKSFRTPVTYFIISLAVVDLITGLVVEPFFAAYYFACYYYRTLFPGKAFDYLFQMGTFVSLVMFSTSFLLVLALTTTQYIAITFPHKYRRFFTKKRVLVSVSCCFVYFSIFSSLQFAKFPKEIYFKINLHLHPTVVGVLLTAAHILLYVSFRKFVRKSKAIRQQGIISQSTSQPFKVAHDSKSEAKQQKQLTVVALFLSALLLLSLFPHIVTFYVFLYTKHQSYEFLIHVSIALRVSDTIMFLKVALDAYIYAWRHPKYRKAVKGAILCHIMQAARERETEQELIATG